MFCLHEIMGTKVFREAKLQGRASGTPEALCLLRLLIPPLFMNPPPLNETMFVYEPSSFK